VYGFSCEAGEEYRITLITFLCHILGMGRINPGDAPPLKNKDKLKSWLARRKAYPKKAGTLSADKSFTIYAENGRVEPKQAIIQALDIENDEQCRRIRKEIKEDEFWSE